MGSSPSIHDIARIAGVSAATVSNALNGKGRVSDKTRAYVQEVARREGYVPNLAARGLREARTRLVGIITPDVSNPFYSEIILGLERGLSERGYACCISDTWDHPELIQRAVDGLTQRQVDGLVLVGGSHSGNACGATPVPTVLVDRWGEHGVGRPLIANDGRAMARDATELLLRRGCTHIAYLNVDTLAGGDDQIEGSLLDGYRDALAAAGLRLDRNLILETARGSRRQASIAAAEKSVGDIFDQGYELDGVVAIGDRVALGAIRALQARERIVGEDTLVVGLDNSVIAQVSSPSITSVERNTKELARAGTEAMLALIEGREATDVVVPHAIVERESTLGTSGQAGRRVIS